MKKTHLLAGGGILAAAVLAALLLGGPREKDPALSGQRPTATRPPVTRPVQTEPAVPEETTVPAMTQPPVWTEPGETTEETIPTEPEETVPAETTEETLPELFPLELEDGLTVSAMFPYSGMNPDAGLEFGEEIAGLQITNTSDRHLALAELTAVLDDGTELHFRVEDLPAGMSAMIFDPENHSLQAGWRCASLDGITEFREEDPLPSELVMVSAEGIAVSLYNVSGEDLTDLRVICHGLLDGSCFGGTTYTYEIPSLSAGESTVIHAVDCILGMAQAVRVELGD